MILFGHCADFRQCNKQATVIFFLGHFIYRFHFRIVEGELQNICYKNRVLDLRELRSHLSGKLLLPASKFFQRPVHPEIQDRDCGVRKLDCHLLMPKRQDASMIMQPPPGAA